MKKFAIFTVIVLLCCALLAFGACGDKDDKKLANGEIRITVGSKSFVAKLSDTKAAKELEKSLPKTLTMNSVNGQYLHGNFDGKTFTEQAAESGILTAGDIMMQGNNTLMFYYATNTYNDSLTKIGRIKSEDITAFVNAVRSALESSGNKTLTIKLSK